MVSTARVFLLISPVYLFDFLGPPLQWEFDFLFCEARVRLVSYHRD